jgi:GNAT superfamily N-acetyltransferase
VADEQRMEEHRDGYTVSTDPARLDVRAIHDYLAYHSYWAQNRPRATVERSLQNSLCFGLYHGTEQVGLARVISDYATYAYLCDVYVIPEHRGKGLSKWLIGCVVAHPDLQNLRRFTLATRDAHGLYAQFGFTPLADPERYMVIKKDQA